MKKILLSIITALTLFNAVALIPLASAADTIIPQITYPNETNPNGSKVSLVAQLPSGTWQQILATVIQMLLSICGTLTFIAFVVGGVMMVTARGAEEQIKKGKAILLWSVVALLVIAVSFAVVTGVTQLLFIQ